EQSPPRRFSNEVQMPFINRPEPGWYAIRGPFREGGGSSRKPMMAGLIYRQCMCSIGHFLRHEWTGDCDRTGGMAGRIESAEVDAFAVWHASPRTPITETEALGLMGRENLYVVLS
ncbi:MAG: hypothetical protein ACPGSW_12335, partial [Phaeobacter italicus]